MGILQKSAALSGPVLRDTARLSQRYPPIVRYGVFGVSTWRIGCDTPSPFSERFPLGEHAKWRCDTPPSLKRGISAILARYPLKTRQMGAIPPSAILSRKGIARYGGVSRTGPLRTVPHCRTTEKKALAYRGKGGQTTATAWLALRLGVVLYRLILSHFAAILWSHSQMTRPY